MAEIFTVNLPDIGEGVVEGEVVEWLKKEGDPLSQDEPVVVVMTDKATVELPAPYPGVLSKQYYRAGELAKLDQPLYDIETEEKITKKQKKVSQACAPQKVVKEKNEEESVRNRVLTTPPVRRMAREMGIDLHTIEGSGKGGRILPGDLAQVARKEEAVAVTVESNEDVDVRPLIGIQGAMARKMTESKRKIPHFSYMEKVDVSRLIQLRTNIQKEGEKEGVQVTYMPFFLRALSLSLNEFPEVNSSYRAKTNALTIYHHHHIGIATSIDKGLIVPVLRYVEKMSLAALIRAFEELKERVHAGTLKPEELKGSTITISNYGALGGGFWAFPIINYPEAAILAVNRIQKQPVVKNDALYLQPTLNLSWSFDHRVIDGDLAARFSHHFATLLQNPARLL